MYRLNPVFINGVKSRMRGLRAPVLMVIYLAIILVLISAIYTMSNASGNYYGVSRPFPERSTMLTSLYPFLAFISFGVIALMAPAMGAGAIASEREKQTLDLLISSRLNAIDIIMGKVFSILVFICFLLFISSPFFAVLYTLGRISILDIVKLFFVLVITSYGCVSVAVFFSSLMKKTAIAAILTYVFLVLMMLVTLIVGAIMLARYEMRMNYNYDLTYIPFLWKINPVFSVLELLSAVSDSANRRDMYYGMGYYYSMSDMNGLQISFLPYYTIFMTCMSAFFNIFSAILIKPVQKFKIT